jgi:hypothetical protein
MDDIHRSVHRRSPETEPRERAAVAQRDRRDGGGLSRPAHRRPPSARRTVSQRGAEHDVRRRLPHDRCAGAQPPAVAVPPGNIGAGARPSSPTSPWSASASKPRPSTSARRPDRLAFCMGYRPHRGEGQVSCGPHDGRPTAALDASAAISANAGHDSLEEEKSRAALLIGVLSNSDLGTCGDCRNQTRKQERAGSVAGAAAQCRAAWRLLRKRC